MKTSPPSPTLYLDVAATTPLNPLVFRRMLPYLTEEYGNPSAVYRLGQTARAAVMASRETVADLIAADPEEIIFTSGATEANNLIIRGVAEAHQASGKHLVISPIDHHSVVNTAKALGERGFEISWLPVGADGRIKVADVAAALRPETILVSIGLVNNEIGVIQDIPKLVQTVKQADPRIFFHTDAVQAIQYLDCRVDRLGVDGLTLSGHKFGGPKGSGVAFIKRGVSFASQVTGGTQEQAHRAGTENVAGIVGLAEAIKQLDRRPSAIRQLTGRRDYLIRKLLTAIPRTRLTGSRMHRAPHIASVAFEGVEGGAVVLALAERGIAVSTGSACTTGRLEPSHVIAALALPSAYQFGSLRFSLPSTVTQKQLDRCVRETKEIVTRLRSIGDQRLFAP